MYQSWQFQSVHDLFQMVTTGTLDGFLQIHTFSNQFKPFITKYYNVFSR